MLGWVEEAGDSHDARENVADFDFEDVYSIYGWLKEW